MSSLEAAEANGVEMEHGCRTGMWDLSDPPADWRGLQPNRHRIYPRTSYPRSREINNLAREMTLTSERSALMPVLGDAKSNSSAYRLARYSVI